MYIIIFSTEIVFMVLYFKLSVLSQDKYDTFAKQENWFIITNLEIWRNTRNLLQHLSAMSCVVSLHFLLVGGFLRREVKLAQQSCCKHFVTVAQSKHPAG